MLRLSQFHVRRIEPVRFGFESAPLRIKQVLRVFLPGKLKDSTNIFRVFKNSKSRDVKHLVELKIRSFHARLYGENKFGCWF